MQLYIEQLKVCGKQTLQSFIGPFESGNARQKFCQVIRQRMRQTRQNIMQHRLDRPDHISEKGVKMALLFLSDDNTKLLMHDGPLPPSLYKKVADKEYRGVFYWYTEDEAKKAHSFAQGV